jgi:hypothetical protein
MEAEMAALATLPFSTPNPVSPPAHFHPIRIEIQPLVAE